MNVAVTSTYTGIRLLVPIHHHVSGIVRAKILCPGVSECLECVMVLIKVKV